jgi:hypothetical protein
MSVLKNFRPDKLPLAVVVLCLGLLVTAALAQPRDIVLRVEEPAVPYAASRLDQHLVKAFSRDQTARVTNVTPEDNTYPQFPRMRYDLDSLANWGTEIGGRFLLTVTITDERLERRKSFHLPLFFHKWESVGVLAGEVRLYDLLRGKLLLAEPFETVLSCKRVFQASMDDQKYDPDIHMTASEKIQFFDRLQAEAADRIIKLTRNYMGVH